MPVATVQAGNTGLVILMQGSCWMLIIHYMQPPACGMFLVQDCHEQYCFVWALVQTKVRQSHGGYSLWINTTEIIIQYVFWLTLLCLLLMFSVFISPKKAYAGRILSFIELFALHKIWQQRLNWLDSKIFQAVQEWSAGDDHTGSWSRWWEEL